MTRRRLLRVVDVAKMLGVSKQRADQLRRRADFPAPVDRWTRGDLWGAADVREWARTYAGSGVVGAAFNAVSTSQVLDLKVGPRLTLTAESGRSARRLATYGWVCIGAAFVCGAISEFVNA